MKKKQLITPLKWVLILTQFIPPYYIYKNLFFEAVENNVLVLSFLYISISFLLIYFTNRLKPSQI